MRSLPPILKSGRSGGRGFTLVEMIVVIAVIGFLAAMLLPALSRARAKGIQTRCAGQLHQIYEGMMLYAGENEQLYMAVNSLAPQVSPPPTPPPGFWYWCGGGSPLADYLGGNVDLEKLTICPSNRTSTLTKQKHYGYAYVVNYHVMAQTGTGYPFKRLTDIPRPRDTILMADTIPGIDWGSGFASVNAGWTRVGTPHLGQVNVLWCDGHISPEYKDGLTDANITAQ